MPRPLSIVPADIPALHLYRYLLREISYLPPAFSKNISNQVRYRFHRNADRSTHAERRLAHGRWALRTLRAANHGDTKCMADLIAKGFGREGRRRRLLLSQFVEPQGADNSSALEALLKPSDTTANSPSEPPNESSGKQAVSENTIPTTHKKHSFLDRWDKPKLLQFLKTQKEAQARTKGSVEWTGSSIKSLQENADIPQTTTWGKPPTESLVRTRQAKWWKRHADKIMPPLGKGEWELLRNLSNGSQAQAEWAVPARRTPARSTNQSDDESGAPFDWQTYATQSTAFVESRAVTKLQRYTGENESHPYRGRAHSGNISARWFRRTYQQVWQKTSYVEQDPNTLRYKFTWGQPALSTPLATDRQRVLFEGVDENGREIKHKEPQESKS